MLLSRNPIHNLSDERLRQDGCASYTRIKTRLIYPSRESPYAVSIGSEFVAKQSATPLLMTTQYRECHSIRGRPALQPGLHRRSAGAALGRFVPASGLLEGGSFFCVERNVLATPPAPTFSRYRSPTAVRPSLIRHSCCPDWFARKSLFRLKAV